MSIPKKHHYVAQMHIKRFGDHREKLWAFHKSGKTAFPADSYAVFAETHLYTSEDATGTKDSSLESEFSVLEGKVNPIITKLVEAARAGEDPELTPDERQIWDDYFYSQWKRVPDMLAKVPTLANGQARLDSLFAEFRARGPEYAAQIDALDTPSERARVLKSAQTQAIRADSPAVKDILRSRGLTLLHIPHAGDVFLLGSYPIIRLPGELTEVSGGAWLPIAPDVAVGPGPANLKTEVRTLTDPDTIDAMNTIVAAQSSTIASASKAVVERYMPRAPEVKDADTTS